jgi:hypothetical protein
LLLIRTNGTITQPRSAPPWRTRALPADMIVIPVDPAEPVRVVAIDGPFPGALRREIGAQRFDSNSFHTPWGPLQVWVGDDSLLGDTIDHNERAFALCRDCECLVPDVGGVAVVTSYDPSTGESVSPHAEVLAYLQNRTTS